MDKAKGILSDAIHAIGAAITSPYPYFGLLGLFAFLGFSALLGKETSTGWDFGGFVLLIVFLVSIGCTVAWLIQKVDHRKMMSADVLIKMKEFESELERRQE